MVTYDDGTMYITPPVEQQQTVLHDFTSITVNRAKVDIYIEVNGTKQIVRCGVNDKYKTPSTVKVTGYSMDPIETSASITLSDYSLNDVPLNCYAIRFKNGTLVQQPAPSSIRTPFEDLVDPNRAERISYSNRLKTNPITQVMTNQTEVSIFAQLPKPIYYQTTLFRGQQAEFFASDTVQILLATILFPQ
jgi:hypothetical protein